MVSQDKGRNDKNNDAIYNGKGNQDGQDIKSKKEEIRSKNE